MSSKIKKNKHVKENNLKKRKKKSKKNKENAKIRNKEFLNEQFRTIQTTLTFTSSIHKENINVIGLTSAEKGDGKSFCALRLARTFAEGGKSVLLIDSDMYNPRLSRQLLVAKKRGLSNYLASDEQFEKYIKSTIYTNLFVLPSGPMHPNINDLYQTNKMEKLIKKANKIFDIVIVDTPPALILNYPRLIGRICDGMIIVTSAGKTKVTKLKEVVNILELANNTILGVILNKKKYSRKELRDYTYY